MLDVDGREQTRRGYTTTSHCKKRVGERAREYELGALFAKRARESLQLYIEI